MKGKVLAVKKGYWKFKDKETDELKVIDNINIVIGYRIENHGCGYAPYVSQATGKPWFTGSCSVFEEFFKENNIKDANALLGLDVDISFYQGKSTIASVK